MGFESQINPLKEDVMNMLQQLHNDESGATATEYLILLVLIAVAVIGLVAAFGDKVSDTFTTATDTIESDLNANAGSQL